MVQLVVFIFVHFVHISYMYILSTHLKNYYVIPITVNLLYKTINAIYNKTIIYMQSM